MSTQTKKQIHLVLAAIALSVSVYLLFPFGNKLLLLARQQHSTEIRYGQEVIYPYITEGDIAVADMILENRYQISRFEPVTIEVVTWTEDPYDDLYWRFNFYNLEPARDLLYAWELTEEDKYRQEMVELVTSFIDTGMENQFAWDLHGTAFRTMTLVYIRSKLFEHDALPDDLDQKILSALAVHGDFLVDPEHYEHEYNHGLDQAAALYLLAINFPELQGLTPEKEPKESWLELSTHRIEESLDTIIDGNGVLVENSPYYHFYVLDKLWQIQKYQLAHDLPQIEALDSKIDQMVAYGVHILQPDLSVPTIGASLAEQKRLSGVYAEMAERYPELKYVLTQGKEGSEPIGLNQHYPIAGQTIMRSGWEKDEAFTNQTQLIFDVGNYRTNHSDLDAFSFHLYSNGSALMPDAGLYTYDPGPYRNYFHGTRAHNTVVVDGIDQQTGEQSVDPTLRVYPGRFEKGEGYVYQSGQHGLYPRVTHERAMAMIEGSTILIIDNLRSDSEHTYEQMFHLFPGAVITTDGLTLTAHGPTGNRELSIQQFITDGLELSTTIDQIEPLDGVCSLEYTTTIPCYAVSYSQTGTNVSYVTVIDLGDTPSKTTFDPRKEQLEVKINDRQYTIDITESEEVLSDISIDKNFNLQSIYQTAQPEYILRNLQDWVDLNRTGDGTTTSTPYRIGHNEYTGALELLTPLNGDNLEVAKTTHLDLLHHNLYFKLKVDRSSSLNGIDLYVSSNNWSEYARFNLGTSVFNVSRDGEWLSYNVNRSDKRNSRLGGWQISDPSFDWSKIDGVKFIVGSKPGISAKVSLKDFSVVPEPTEARAVIIFDDGWSSVLKTLPIMEQYGYQGNVGVITGSVGQKRYLTLDELQMLQNEYDWDLVNHTSLHKHFVNDYKVVGDLLGYEEEVTNALQYLIKNDINSAPNWFIYPNGIVDGEAKEIIRKYYKFARATVDGPEAFPFADPLEVRIFSAYEDRASVSDVQNAIQDAITYNQTLMLMFHRFTEEAPSVYTEWQLSEFEAVLQSLHDQGIKVVTLSELDEENGVPPTQFTIQDFMPHQINLAISVTDNTPQGPLQKFKSWFKR